MSSGSDRKVVELWKTSVIFEKSVDASAKLIRTQRVPIHTFVSFQHFVLCSLQLATSSHQLGILLHCFAGAGLVVMAGNCCCQLVQLFFSVATVLPKRAMTNVVKSGREYQELG